MQRDSARIPVRSPENGDLFAWVQAGISDLWYTQQLVVTELHHHIGSGNGTGSQRVAKDGSSQSASDGGDGCRTDREANSRTAQCAKGAVGCSGLGIAHANRHGADYGTFCEGLGAEVFSARVALIAQRDGRAAGQGNHDEGDNDGFEQSTFHRSLLDGKRVSCAMLTHRKEQRVLLLEEKMVPRHFKWVA
ncbi:hypothetical protein Atc_2135 [Acidithiobacillus caldus SM-1]|uniref:Uncharacterized protein n=1 Tax=Acidithiobacillus caldus (strain SM-1) TaxID=990288 RepID=F9ZRZ9_ACICS|nr:hypothetical protein Atc_2135 [Acidithiobacillus caldus SM-1]